MPIKVIIVIVIIWSNFAEILDCFVLRDFNFPDITWRDYSRPDNEIYNIFINLLDELEFHQFVQFPTRQANLILSNVRELWKHIMLVTVIFQYYRNISVNNVSIEINKIIVKMFEMASGNRINMQTCSMLFMHMINRTYTQHTLLCRAYQSNTCNMQYIHTTYNSAFPCNAEIQTSLSTHINIKYIKTICGELIS